MFRRSAIFSGSVLAAALLLGACSDPPVAAPLGTGPNVLIQALDNTFRPGEVTVPAGATLTFSNVGRNDHNVLLSSGSGDWGVATEDFAPGDEYRVVLTEPGVYPYYCSLHATPDAGMIGVIEVVNATED